MDYLYLSAVLVGGLVVNCGILLMLRIISGKVLGVISLFLGGGLLLVTVLAADPPATDHSSEQVSAQEVEEIRTPIVSGLTVRVGPGSEYESAGSIWQVNPGDKLRVVEDTLGWVRFRIKYFDPNWSGWVAKSYTTVWDTYVEMQRVERLRKDG